MKLKTVQVSLTTWQRLMRLKTATGQSFDEIIQALLDNRVGVKQEGVKL